VVDVGEAKSLAGRKLQTDTSYQPQLFFKRFSLLLSSIYLSFLQLHRAVPIGIFSAKSRSDRGRYTAKLTAGQGTSDKNFDWCIYRAAEALLNFFSRSGYQRAVK
jgi:hypothetical protein